MEPFPVNTAVPSDLTEPLQQKPSRTIEETQGHPRCYAAGSPSLFGRKPLSHHL